MISIMQVMLSNFYSFLFQQLRNSLTESHRFFCYYTNMWNFCIKMGQRFDIFFCRYFSYQLPLIPELLALSDDVRVITWSFTDSNMGMQMTPFTEEELNALKYQFGANYGRNLYQSNFIGLQLVGLFLLIANGN